MESYTADAVSMLVYLVDALPHAADRVFAEAEAGEAVIQAPSTALAEVLYSVGHDTSIRGVSLAGTPDDARRALVEDALCRLPQSTTRHSSSTRRWKASLAFTTA